MMLHEYALKDQKILFIGRFNKEYWNNRYRAEQKNYTFVVTGDVTDSLFSEYELALVACDDSQCLTVFSEYQTSVTVEVQRGTVDECAERLICVDVGVAGLDIGAVIDVLSGNEPASYYGGLSVEEAKKTVEQYGPLQGMFMVVHIPETAEMETVTEYLAQVHEGCPNDMSIVWTGYVEKNAEISLDLFIC